MARSAPAFLIVAALAAAGSTARAAGGGGGGGEGLHFVPMEAIEVPIIEGDRVAGALRFKIVLDAADGAAATRLGNEAPRLRSAAVAAGLEFARLDVSALRAVNVERLDQALSDAFHEVDPGIARVLIVEVGARQR